MARAVVAATPRTGIKGAVAKIDLTLKVVTDATVGGGIKADPAIMIYQGVTLDFSVGGSVERKYTIDTHLKFDIKLKAASTDICNALPADLTDGDIGFSQWFTAILAEVDHAEAGEPLATVTNYSYDANFAVTAKQNSGGELGIVPIKITASQTYQRDDIQNIKVTIDTVPQRTAGGEGKDEREFQP